MLAHPDRVRAQIIQNANAYREGLGAKWTGIAQYWAHLAAILNGPRVSLVRKHAPTPCCRQPGAGALQSRHLDG